MDNNELAKKLFELTRYLDNFYSGYKECSELALAPKTKNLLSELSIKSLEMLNELKCNINYLKEIPVSEAIAGPIHQTLLNLKSIINSHDMDSIIAEIQCGEIYLRYFYLELVKEEMPIHIKELLTKQLGDVENRIKRLDTIFLYPENLN